MPERWERELRELRRIEPDRIAVRGRVERGPSGDRMPPRRDRIVAGAVAAVVAIGAIALVMRTLPGGPVDVGSTDLPVLTASFHDSTVVAEGPDASYRRVETTIVYGDAVDGSHTSTISPNAIPDWVPAEDLTLFVPGPTVGSPVRFEADGDDPRVLLGRLQDWPNFGWMERIDRLPEQPGEYLLVFVADYPEGIARTARRVHVVEPGIVQLVATEGERFDAATAAAYVDGRRTDGFLSASWYMAGDVGQTGPRPIRQPELEGEPPIRAAAGAPLVLASPATDAMAGLFETYDAFDPDRSLPIDLLSLDSAIEGKPGRALLALDVLWRHGQTGLAQDGTAERAIFFFPVEIQPTQEQTPTPAPSVEASPSPAPVSPGSVVIEIRRSSEETGDPEAIARFGGQEQWMCPDGWSVVSPDGTTESVVFDCGQNNLFEAPSGTPITVSGDFATVNVSARLSGDGSTGAPTDEVADVPAGTIVTYAYEVTWDDGSEASFWLLVTVAGGHAPVPGRDPSIVVNVFGLGERAHDEPTATFSFGGETRTACTQDYEWIQPDGTTIGDEMQDTSACSARAIEVPPGTLIAVEAATTTRVTTTRTTTQFYEGDVGLVVSAEWAEGNATFIVPLTVTEATRDHQLVVLDCPPNVQVDFADESDERLLPGGSLYITANLPGFERDDVVEQMTRKVNGESEWSGVWQVVRDGQVVASIDWDALSGTACRGSGIGGT